VLFRSIRRVILSTGHLAEAVERHFHSQPVNNVRVTCVPETNPLGTAGGFLNAIRGATEKPAAWLVLNGDSLAPAPLAQMFQLLDDPDCDGAILGVHVADASRFGTILPSANGDLTGFSEKKPGAGIINAGVYLFRPATIERFPKKTPLSFETEVFPALVADKIHLKACVTDAPFLDIGTPESLGQAERFVGQHASQFS
jgi:NDP-sugar pyrophosphorylase family protein